MLNFPDAPVVDQTYTDGTTAWKWDGAKWVTTLLFTDAPSDSSTYGRRNAAWNKVLPLTGGTLTGDLTVNSLNLIVGTSTTAGANLTLNSVSPPSSNVDAGIRLQSAGRNRWWVHLNGIEGGGTNFGSNLVINSVDDAGVLLGSPLVISRWSGIVSFTASPTGPTPAAGDSSTKFATTAFAKTLAGGYLPLAGGVLTGPVTASDFTVGTNTTSGATLALNGPASNYRTLQFYTAAKSRWAVYVNPETGSGNVGSDFIINRYDDTGAFVGQALGITRASGNVTLGSALYVNGSATFGTGTGTTSVGATMNGGAASSRFLQFQTAGKPRWMCSANTDPESTGNVGSNFAIYRYDDAGVYLSNPLLISRATGAITLTGSVTVVGAFTATGLLSSASLNTNSIELGAPGSVNTPFIDFHSAGTSNDFDVRLLVSGGGAANGTGTLNITASTLQVNGGATITGDLSIGTNTAPQQIVINGPAGTTRVIRWQTAGSGRWAMFTDGVSSPETGGNAGSNFVINRYDDTGASMGQAFSITRSTGAALISGDLTITGIATKPGGGSWAVPSDERIKTVHGDYDRGLDAICALQPVRYSYLGNATLTAPPEQDEDETWLAKHYLAPADQDGTERIGLVAQAVERTFPECVTATLGYIDGEEVDDMRHLDTSPMLFALCNAVRELRDRVVELEAAAR